MLKGQLNQIERNYLHNLVIDKKPDIILESGTWYGGGSTLAMVSALKNNNKGILYTYETHIPFYNVATKYYRNSIYYNYIKLLNEDFVIAISNLGEDFYKKVSIVFLDGGDENQFGQLKLPICMYPESSENLASFKILENKVNRGTHVICHDWLVENGRGTFIKWYLDLKKWEGWKLEFLEQSYGMAHLIKT
jgi:hypothetical protein